MPRSKLDRMLGHVLCHKCPFGLLCPESDLDTSRKTEPPYNPDERPDFLRNATTRMQIATNNCPLLKLDGFSIFTHETRSLEEET